MTAVEGWFAGRPFGDADGPPGRAALAPGVEEALALNIALSSRVGLGFRVLGLAHLKTLGPGRVGPGPGRVGPGNPPGATWTGI